MFSATHMELSFRQRLGLEAARLQHQNLVRLHPLRQLFWECTLCCNLHCRHCGSDCRQSAAVPDMPATDFLRVIDSLTPHVHPHEVIIIIIGGEPLVRPDLEEVGLQLYQRGYPWGIVSNGFALTPERLQRLLQAGMHAMTISLDGFGDDHNWMRGQAESFERAWRAICMLADEKQLAWDVVTCVNRRNYPYLEELKQKLWDAGVRRWRLFTVFPVGRAARHPELQLTKEEFTGVMEFIRRTRQEGKMSLSYSCEGFLGRYEGLVRDHFFACHAGITIASVLADGSISACPSIRSDFSQGNIYHDDLWTVWNERYQPFRDRSWTRQGECADCRFFRYCLGSGMHLRSPEGDLLFCHYQRL